LIYRSGVAPVRAAPDADRERRPAACPRAA